jgi:hypothetical protein
MTQPILCDLLPGECFDDLAGPCGAGWCLQDGAVRLDPTSGPARPALLALPGDVLGVEATAMGGCPYRLRALLPTRLRALRPAATAGEQALRLQALLRQQWRRAVDMAGLRTGSVPDRVRQLLVMLRSCGNDGEVLMPRLRDLADTVDSTPESVSRVIANLRRLQLLSHLQHERRHQAGDALAGAELPPGMTRSRADAMRIRL